MGVRIDLCTVHYHSMTLKFYIFINDLLSLAPRLIICFKFDEVFKIAHAIVVLFFIFAFLDIDNF